MANLHQLLKAMVEKGASDLHITTGSPPQLRIDGKLVPLKTTPLSPVETKQLCYSILTDAQKHRFEENLELDFSFGIKGLARFRSNVFMQRGAVAAVQEVLHARSAAPISGPGTFREAKCAGPLPAADPDVGV